MLYIVVLGGNIATNSLLKRKVNKIKRNDNLKISWNL